MPTYNLSIVPSGAKEKAQHGLSLIKEAILELAKANPKGVSNAETAHLLGLRSDHAGKQKDYLTYSVLGILMGEGKVEKENRKYIAKVG